MAGPGDDNRNSWWNGRRPRFSVAVALGYVATVLLHETFAPYTVGDHIGLSPPAVFFYGVGAFLWVVGANFVFTICPVFERRSKPVDLRAFRRKAWLLALGFGVSSFPLFYIVMDLVHWVTPR